MSPELGMFIGVSAVAVAGGVGTVASGNVVYASLFLLVTLISVAGIYILIFAPFLAVVQVLIYGGAIIVVVLFALMLTRSSTVSESLDNRQKPLAIVAGVLALGTLLFVIMRGSWPAIVGQDELAPVSVSEIGNSLFTRWAVPFELASLLLLVALIGAVILAKPGAKDD